MKWNAACFERVPEQEWSLQQTQAMVQEALTLEPHDRADHIVLEIPWMERMQCEICDKPQWKNHNAGPWDSRARLCHLPENIVCLLRNPRDSGSRSCQIKKAITLLLQKKKKRTEKEKLVKCCGKPRNRTLAMGMKRHGYGTVQSKLVLSANKL